MVNSYIGFIFWDKLPRHTDEENVRKVYAELSKSAEKPFFVGAIVDPDLPELVALVQKKYRLWLAGGVNPDNVKEIINSFTILINQFFTILYIDFCIKAACVICYSSFTQEKLFTNLRISFSLQNCLENVPFLF